MAATYNPIPLQIIQSILSGTGQALESTAEAQQQLQLQQAAQQAIQNYSQDQSIENLLKLSQFIDLQKVAQFANVQNQIQQQQSQTTEPLAHLNKDEQSQFLSRSNQMQALAKKSQLARSVRFARDIATAKALSKELGSERISDKEKSIDKYRDVAKDIEEQAYKQLADDYLQNTLDSIPYLSPQQRFLYKNIIRSDSRYQKHLLDKVQDLLYTKDLEPNPYELFNVVAQTAENVLKDILGIQQPTQSQQIPVQQQIQQQISQEPTPQNGKITLPTYQDLQGPTTPQDTTPTKTEKPSERIQEIISQTQQSKAQTPTQTQPKPQPKKKVVKELNPTEVKPLKFPKSPIQFVKDVRQNHPELKALSNNDLTQYFNNRQLIKQAKQDPQGKSIIYLRTPTGEQAKINAQIDRIKAGVIEEGLYSKLPFSESKRITDILFNDINTDQRKEIVSNIKSRKDYEDVVAQIVNRGNVDVNTIHSNLPTHDSDTDKHSLAHTAAIGAYELVMSLADSWASNQVLARIPGLQYLAFLASTYSTFKSYRRRFEKNLTWQSFFREPRTLAEASRDYGYRKMFLDEFSAHFNDEQRTRILDNNLKPEDLKLIASLLNKKTTLEKLIDVTARPVRTTISHLPIPDVANLENTLYAKYSDYQPSAVLGAQLLGSFLGTRSAHNNIINSRYKSLGIPKNYENTSNVILTKAVKHIDNVNNQYSHILGNAGLSYSQRLKDWIQGKGTVVYEPYKQSAWFTHPVTIGTLSSMAIGFLDYGISNYTDFPEWAQTLTPIIASSLLSGFNQLYFASEQRKLDLLHKREATILSQVTKDLKGSYSQQHDGSFVYVLPPLQKQLIQYPTGRIALETIQPKGIKPYTPFTGSVSLHEFSQTPTYNPLSAMALYSELQDMNQNFKMPAFMRSQITDVVGVDVDNMRELINQSRHAMHSYIENSKNYDIGKRLGLHQDSQYLPTNTYEPFSTPELKALATEKYQTVDSLLNKDSNITQIQNSLISDLHDYIELQERQAVATKGGTEPTRIIKDTLKILEDESFSPTELLKERKKCTKALRKIKQELALEYDANKEIVKEQYEFIIQAIDSSLPQDVYNNLLEADNLYASYKFSENVDKYLDKFHSVDSLEQWNNTKTSFNNEKQHLFSTFRNTKTQEAIKQSINLEDYTEHAINAQNIALLQQGKIIKTPSFKDLKYDDILKSLDPSNYTALTVGGKFTRPLSLLAKSAVSHMSQELINTSTQTPPFAISSDIAPLVHELRNQFKVRQTTQETSQKKLTTRESALAKSQELRKKEIIKDINAEPKSLETLTRKYISEARIAYTQSDKLLANKKLQTYYQILTKEQSRVKQQFQKDINKQIKILKKELEK